MKTSKNGNFTFEPHNTKMDYGLMGTIYYKSNRKDSFIKLYPGCFYVHSAWLPINTELLEFIEELRKENG